jgi:DNA adenine methylase
MADACVGSAIEEPITDVVGAEGAVALGEKRMIKVKRKPKIKPAENVTIISAMQVDKFDLGMSSTIAEYLRKLKTKDGYKRVSVSPLRYAGGKSKAVGLILSHFPILREKKIVSPFFGGGSFEIALSKELGFHVIGYDIFGILINFWNQILQHPTEFADELSKLIPTKEEYTKNRHILLSYWEKVKPLSLEYKTKNLLSLTDEQKTMLDKNELLQAVYYYYNMQLSYGPMFLGWPSSVYLKQGRYNAIIQNVRNFKAGNLEVHCSSFEDVLQKHTNDFLFLDPPYYLGNDSKMFKGMYPNCNFAIHHNGFNHELLRDLLKKHKGGFFITYNDCPTIREWYKEFKQEYPKWQYTYGQGETRIGKNRDGTNIKESHEIFIICPPQHEI